MNYYSFLEVKDISIKICRTEFKNLITDFLKEIPFTQEPKGYDSSIIKMEDYIEESDIDKMISVRSVKEIFDIIGLDFKYDDLAEYGYVTTEKHFFQNEISENILRVIAKYLMGFERIGFLRVYDDEYREEIKYWFSNGKMKKEG